MSLPTYWLRAYIEMLGTLQAEENLNARTVGLLASGHVEKSDDQKIVARWKKACQIEGKMSKDQLFASAAAMGIGVKRGV